MNRIEVLKMVEAGQLSAAEAAARLAGTQKPTVATTTPEGKPRWLHVLVTNLDTGKPKVTVNVPMSWVQVGLAIGARFTPELHGLDWKTIAEALNNQTDDKLVEVEDLEKGERVEVYLD